MQTAEDDDKEWTSQRAAMVEVLRRYRISSEPVLAAMGRVKRHLFVPEKYRASAYANSPSPIGHNQTISQPYIVAYMTEMMELQPGDKVLEIGAGSGYQAAILAELGTEVYTLEIVPDLARSARAILRSEGYAHVHVIDGDGFDGLPDKSPFDCIIVTCSPQEVPDALVEQLKEGGRMILPLDTGDQRLIVMRKHKGQISREDGIMVRFVPMIHGDCSAG